MCNVELCLYDGKKWYSIFNVFKPVYLAIRYDEQYHIVLKNLYLHKIESSKIVKKFTCVETKEVDCKSLYVGKLWLENCLVNKRSFVTPKSFAMEYVSIVTAIKENH